MNAPSCCNRCKHYFLNHGESGDAPQREPPPHVLREQPPPPQAPRAAAPGPARPGHGRRADPPRWPPGARTVPDGHGDAPTVPGGHGRAAAPTFPEPVHPARLLARPLTSHRDPGGRGTPARSDRHRARSQPHEEARPPARHPYPSFCFSSLVMGTAPAVPMDVAVTRQSAAVVATRLHGARWGTGDPQPRPPPASLMAPRFRARAAATPGRWDTLWDARGQGAASRAEGGMRSPASRRRRRAVPRSHRAGLQRQRCHRCHRPPPSAARAPPPAFRCRSLGNHLPRRYFRVGLQT